MLDRVRTEVKIGYVMEMKQLCEKLKELAGNSYGNICRVQVALSFTVLLEDLIYNWDQDPRPLIESEIESQLSFIRASKKVLEHTSTQRVSDANQSGLNRTKKLFENAWTVYNPETYRHSVELVAERLKASGFDGAFFSGKHCFDGGCGTGRLSIAMAQLGAERVTGADIGAESLKFAKERATEFGVADKIDFVEQDISDLSNVESDSYDFVATNGVLHHTEHTERGVGDHYRITKSGGIFWVYLYGKGGVYWELFDQLKASLQGIEYSEVRNILLSFGVRQGLCYTFLDNVLAPIRKYYSLEEVFQMFGEGADYSWERAKGTSPVDDSEMILNSKFGKYLFGPEAEMRLVIRKR